MAEKIVLFDKWCKTCKYRFKKESQDPCAQCLEYPVNTDSTKPVEYKETKNRRKSK